MSEGKGWRDRVESARVRVSQAAADAGGAARQLAEHNGNRSNNLISGGTTALSDAVLRLPSPSPNLDFPWRIGLAQLVADQPAVPVGAGRFLGVLDRVGSISISRAELDFDGENVAWETVHQISVAPVRELLTSYAMQHEIDRLMAVLPRLPGRKWAVRQVADTLVGLASAVGRLDERGGDTLNRLVPCTVISRGRLRTKTIGPGVFGVLILAARPEIADVITSTATAREITLTAPPPSRATERAATMTAFATSLRDRLQQAEVSADENTDA